ncbi:MAG: hypothetical protein KUG79_15145 [Pseudomonadales bacterium]|nr:hypothetical protein [Pseudomonadales bacterium]
MSFSQLLADTLALLADNAHPFYRSLATKLDGRIVVFEIDINPVVLRFENGAHFIDDEVPLSIDLALSTDRATIVELVDGDALLIDLVINDKLKLTGAPDSLAIFHEAMLIYVNALTREKAAPAMYQKFTGH